MVNLERAIDYVMNYGSEVDKAKMNLILGQKTEESRQKILDYYTLLQNNDGGFPFQKKKGNISTFNETILSLMILTDYELDECKLFQKALEFLFNHQDGEGFWDEPEELRELNPPFWDAPGEVNTRIWLTAEACHLLALLGYTPSQYQNRGINFLLKNREADGKIKGFLHSNWIAVAIFGILQGADSELVEDFIRIVEQNFDKIEGTSDLSWCLECFHDGGIQKTHPLVLRMITSLKEVQKEDGHWASTDGKEFDIQATIAAIKILKKLGEI